MTYSVHDGHDDSVVIHNAETNSHCTIALEELHELQVLGDLPEEFDDEDLVAWAVSERRV